MVLVKLDIRKTLEQNADAYFAQAKKMRKKIEGAKKALEKNLDAAPKTVEKKEKKILRKLAWYEKFRWFISSDGFLCVGGRDATTNEIIIKKHTLKDDLVFHTDMAGSPFVVIQAKGKTIPQRTIIEAAQFTASMSRAWKNGLGVLDVFYVLPEQVSKEAQTGEFLPKGAFMIRGKTTYVRPEVSLSCCIIDYDGEKFMVAPKSACETHAVQKEHILNLKQGSDKPSDCAKKIQRLLKTTEDLDTILRSLPPGGITLEKS